MKPLPFKMRQETAMEKYRAETWDTKEPECLEWIRAFHEDEIFFDVGANIGIYTLTAASWHRQMRIFSFEPVPQNYQRLCANIILNRFENITPYPYAIGANSEMMELEVPNYQIGASGAQVCKDSHSKISVPLMMLDQMDAIPDHVKIDIDGQELGVIQGMSECMMYAQSILIEVSSKTRQAALDLILPHGFTTDNRFNTMTPHSRERRAVEGIDAENIIFTR